MTAFEAIFEPVGIRADEPRPDEDRGDATKLWVANPRRQNSASNICAAGAPAEHMVHMEGGLWSGRKSQ